MTTTPLLAFSLGGPEVAIIFVLMLLLFGAKKLPELARGMGKSLGEFKKAKQEFEEEIKYGDLQAREDKPAHACRLLSSANRRANSSIPADGSPAMAGTRVLRTPWPHF